MESGEREAKTTEEECLWGQGADEEEAEVKTSETKVEGKEVKGPPLPTTKPSGSEVRLELFAYPSPPTLEGKGKQIPLPGEEHSQIPLARPVGRSPWRDFDEAGDAENVETRWANEVESCGEEEAALTERHGGHSHRRRRRRHGRSHFAPVEARKASKPVRSLLGRRNCLADLQAVFPGDSYRELRSFTQI